MSTRMFRRWGHMFVLAVMVWMVPAGPLFAQVSDDDRARAAAGVAILGGMLIFLLIFALAMYIYTSLALQTIAKKTNTENAWMAWIPIINILLMLNVAKKPLWWFILCLIPIVNIVILIIVWMAIAEARNKPNWWGILMIVPLINIVVPGYLAWAD